MVVGIHSWHFWLAAIMDRAGTKGQRKFLGRDEVLAKTAQLGLYQDRKA